MADSPRGSETSAIDLTFALEAAGETQPQRASDKASGEWLPFTAAGDTPTYAAAVSPTHASPLRRPRSRGVNTVSFDAAPDRPPRLPSLRAGNGARERRRAAS